MLVINQNKPKTEFNIKRLCHILHVRYCNWKVRKVTKAHRILSNSLQKNKDLARSYQSNIAMIIYDRSKHETLSAQDCNIIADEIMLRLFDVKT